jgi:crossover junction endodeoxyribonuclease RusA
MGDIELPFPGKILWPNGRGNHFAKHREFKKHKQWAWGAAKAARWFAPAEGGVKWAVTLYPKTANRIDRDNALASLKAYQDGIAEAMGLNDADFETPSLQFAEPVKNGKVVVRIEA